MNLLTPEALVMLRTVAEQGSLAAAARELGLVPSALTYRVRQIEDGLDVLLFDRSARKATLTDAGLELIAEGNRILGELDAVAQRVKRVATGWESQFTVAVGGLIAQRTVMELCEAFFAPNPPTQLKIRTENLSGSWEVLTSGLADVTIGSIEDGNESPGIVSRPLGDVQFVFAVAPHHPLAALPEPLKLSTIAQHRAVAVADSARRGPTMTVGLQPGQRVLTVADMQSKLNAQLRGLGCGYLPECMAQPYLTSGRLVPKRTEQAPRMAKLNYAWRATSARKAPSGKALAWWLQQLEIPATRQALLHGQ